MHLEYPQILGQFLASCIFQSKVKKKMFTDNFANIHLKTEVCMLRSMRPTVNQLQ